MVTSSLGKVSSIIVHLPKAVQTGEQKQSNIIISITERNEVFINDVKYDINSLLDEIKRIQGNVKDKTVIIRGDRKANYETIVKVMDYLNQAGIPKFTLSTVK